MSSYPRQIDECPVCYHPLKVSTCYVNDWYGPLCEQYEDCPNGCYSYRFAYGYTEVYVTVNGHHVQYGWAYSDDRETLQAESDAIDVTVEAARRAQLEDYWKLVHGRAPATAGSDR